MQQVAAKFAPKHLSHEQKQNQLKVVQDILEWANLDPDFIKKIISWAETWVMAMSLRQMSSYLKTLKFSSAKEN